MTRQEGVQARRCRGMARTGIIGVLVLVLAAGAYLSWEGIGFITAEGFTSDAWWFVLGCAAAGIVLRVLNNIVGRSRTLSSFVPHASRPAP